MSESTTGATLVACLALLAGLLLRAGVRPLRAIFVPASVVGGAVAFAALQTLLRVGDASVGYDGAKLVLTGSPAATQTWAKGVVDVLYGWPGTLIAVVFAGLLLEHRPRPAGKLAGGAARAGLAAWITIMGQVALGLGACWALAWPARYGVPGQFGQLLEVGFAGGVGSAGAMAAVWEARGFEAGRALGFFFATVGLAWGVLSGIALVNVGARMGWLAQRDEAEVKAAEAPTGLEERLAPRPALFARAATAAVDPLVLQIVLVALAFGAGHVLRAGFLFASGALPEGVSKPLSNVPLFLFTLIGGWLVRQGLRAARLSELVDPPGVARVVGTAMEFLIVSALATLRVDLVAQYAEPVIVLLVIGAAWCIVAALAVGRWLLPRGYWFELTLVNYGMSTATTAQGLLLLRLVDRDLSTGAAEDYAAAAPMTAPFVGGGVLTVVGFPAAVDALGLGATAALTAGATVALCGVGALMNRGRRSERVNE